MLVYDRKNKVDIEEVEQSQGSLEFLYNTVIGRFLLKYIAIRPFFSKLCSIYFNSRLSKKDIKPFIEEYNIDMSKCERSVEDFKSYNDFFCRKKYIDFSTNEEDFISIADSKLMVYDIDENLGVKVKGNLYSVEDLFGGYRYFLDSVSSNSYCMVFRLSTTDYHRYIHFDEGYLISNKKIKGVLHTVRPISDKYKVFKINSREVNCLCTKHGGIVYQIEVGALEIGKIKNNCEKLDKFSRGEEKGHFEFGGSTIILIVSKDKVKIDEDILEANRNGKEVKVSIGERLGEFIDKSEW